MSGGMSYYTDTRHGVYRLEHPEKYISGAGNPVYKSGWEQSVFVALDSNPYVLKWGYEPFPIFYVSPATMKSAVYKPDLYCECATPDGKVRKFLIEIKPSKYMTAPKIPKPPSPGCTDRASLDRYARRMTSYKRVSMDVMVNMAKWKAAQDFCATHGIEWCVMNEKNTPSLFR